MSQGDAERKLSIAMIQSAGYGKPASFDIEQNRASVLELVERCCSEHSPDVVLLPEVFTAPYFCSSHDERYWQLAETIPGPSTDAIAALATRHGCYIFVPLFEKVLEGEYYDSCALIGPDGKLVPATLHDGGTLPSARKMHIASIHSSGTRTDEKFWFRPGQGFVNFHTPLGIFGCLVCYDRSFSEAWRTLALAGAEIVFIPVVSYGFREGLFIAELRTMASQNGVFAVAANRVGIESVDFDVTMFGNSCLIDPLGEIIVQGASGSEAKGPEILVAEIDVADVARARVRVPYMRDRRTDAYVT